MRDLLNAYREAFRMWLRRRTRPLSIEEAEEKRLFLAKVYALTGIAVLGYHTYYVAKKNYNFPIRKDLPKNIATALALSNNNNFTFITYDGFKKVEDFKYTREELEKIAEGKLIPNAVTENSKEPKTV